MYSQGSPKRMLAAVDGEKNTPRPESGPSDLWVLYRRGMEGCPLTSVDKELDGTRTLMVRAGNGRTSIAEKGLLRLGERGCCQSEGIQQAVSETLLRVAKCCMGLDPYPLSLKKGEGGETGGARHLH